MRQPNSFCSLKEGGVVNNATTIFLMGVFIGNEAIFIYVIMWSTFFKICLACSEL